MSFEPAEQRFQSIFGPVVLQQDPNFFTSGEYQERQGIGQAVFEHLRPAMAGYLAVVRGIKSGMEIGCPAIEAGINLPSRVLKQPSTLALSEQSRLALDGLIQDTFELGLVTHLLLYDYRSRAETDRVDPMELLRVFGTAAVAADREMAGYDRENAGIPKAIELTHWTKAVEPALKKQLGLGHWKLGKCHAHFNNLFFAGALLGMMYDLHTENG